MANLKLISWNVNGIRAVVKKGFFQLLLKKEQPDVLCLQEVKIDSTARAAHEFDFAEYKEFWNSAERPGYSGTAILVRKNSPLITKEFPRHTNGIRHPEFDAEGRVQTLEFKTFFLINAYFPNARDDLSRLAFKQIFNKKMLAYVQKLKKKKPVIVVGDYNVAHQEIDIARPKENEGKKGFTKKEREGFGNMVMAGFVDTFRAKYPNKKDAYTWWSHWANARQRNVGWRIDYVCVSKKLMPKVKEAFILPDVMGSDHCPVGITLSV